jgi:hypothetical protein
MLSFAERVGVLSDRKARLFAVACVRREWAGLQQDASKQAVEVAERFADGDATATELETVYALAETAVDSVGGLGIPEDLAIAAWRTADSVAKDAAWMGTSYSWDGDMNRTNIAHAVLIREVFNPFHSTSLDPLLLTPSVITLAQAAYDERRMPSGILDNTILLVLADHVEEAGCTDAEILAHLRKVDGVHVRGCWCIDLLLKKA